MKQNLCPNCLHSSIEIFYSVEKVPVNSMIHVPTRSEALAFPTGDIHLGFCGGCGFIFNTAFDSDLAEYSYMYDSTQRHSGTFSKFNDALAEDLVVKHDLYNRKIIEIGCGEGEFLYLLCQKGANTGIGFDPAYRDSNLISDTDLGITFIPDYFSEKYSHYEADFIVCKMTLEHIQDVGKFVSMIRENVETNSPTVFFQVPNFEKPLRDGAFWDVYYEHCSYFTSGSLTGCFESNGFTVTELSTGFENQYLMLEAVPSPISCKDEEFQECLSEQTGLINSFRSLTADLRDIWLNKLSSYERSGKKIVIWGASSKGVSFLTTLETRDTIQYAVDINPNKKGMFIPGSGQKIVGPQELQDIKPDTVIVMNPVYMEEIRRTLMDMGLSPTLLSVEHL